MNRQCIFQCSGGNNYMVSLKVKTLKVYIHLVQTIPTYSLGQYVQEGRRFFI